MLVELGLVEQRYRAVCEVLDGATVVDVARRNRVARQTVHDWLRAYAEAARPGWLTAAPGPSRVHQMAPAVEARILELRRAHPGWGPAPSAIASAARLWCRCPDARRSIAAGPPWTDHPRGPVRGAVLDGAPGVRPSGGHRPVVVTLEVRPLN